MIPYVTVGGIHSYATWANTPVGDRQAFAEATVPQVYDGWNAKLFEDGWVRGPRFIPGQHVSYLGHERTVLDTFYWPDAHHWEYKLDGMTEIGDHMDDYNIKQAR